MDSGNPASARITWRSLAGIESELAPAGAVEILRSGEVAPWRQFRWHRGQAHYSGLYWSATTGGHVAYESRLELARMLLADFAPQVRWIVAQPFLVEAVVAGQSRRHVPDIARRFLDAGGCGEEPLTWSPPGQWVDLDGLPEPGSRHRRSTPTRRLPRRGNRRRRPHSLQWFTMGAAPRAVTPRPRPPLIAGGRPALLVPLSRA